MDSMWSETQSSNRMDIATRPPTAHGKFVSEKLIYCKTELKPNEIPHRFNTLRESSSYGIEIINQKTHLFQSDFQTRKPLHISEHPIGSNTDIQLYEKGTCRGISATQPKIPSMDPNDNTFDKAYLDPREVQKRVQSHVAGIWLDSDNVPQCHQGRASKGTSSHQINDTETFYPDDTLGVISLDPRKPKTRMASYGAGIRSDLHKTHQSHQETSTNQMENPRKMYPECIAGATSLDVREVHTRMPPDGEATKSDSANAVQTHFTNGIPSSQIKNPRKMYPVNIPGATSSDRRVPSDSVATRSDSANAVQTHFTNGIPSSQIQNPREMYPVNIPGASSLDRRMPSDRVATRSDPANAVETHVASFTSGIPSNKMVIPKEAYSENNPVVTSLDPKEAQRTTPPFKYDRQSDSDVSQSHQASSTKEIPSYQIGNSREKNSDNFPGIISLDSKEVERRMTPNGEEIPLYQTELEEDEVLTYQADAGNYEEMKASNQTNINRGSSLDQPVNCNLSSTRTCPYCHCVLATQPRPSYIPSLDLEKARHARPSVIMIPLKRKEHKEDSYSSGEDEKAEKRHFRVNISGTTARFKLTKDDWARMPVRSFPSGGRLLGGHWTRIFTEKVKESNPWCSMRFKNNHVRSANSRKIHSAVFFRGAAECKYPECNVKMKFVIRKEYGKRVEVTYVGNVCHRDRPAVGCTRSHETNTRTVYDNIEVKN